MPLRHEAGLLPGPDAMTDDTMTDARLRAVWRAIRVLRHTCAPDADRDPEVAFLGDRVRALRSKRWRDVRALWGMLPKDTQQRLWVFTGIVGAGRA